MRKGLKRKRGADIIKIKRFTRNSIKKGNDKYGQTKEMEVLGNCSGIGSGTGIIFWSRTMGFEAGKLCGCDGDD